MFELPTRNGGKLGKVKTEILFIERCLSLLKPGGRLGIVLPEGIFNNPSLAYVRRFCEDRAFVRAVVSLPQDTFVSSGASVKASLLFMQKYTEAEQADYDRKKTAADKETRAKYAGEIQKETARLVTDIDAAKDAKDAKRQKEAQAALVAVSAGHGSQDTGRSPGASERAFRLSRLPVRCGARRHYRHRRAGQNGIIR